MKSRLIAGLAAVVLAVVGALLVFTYAQAADERAVAGMEPVEVLVVQENVPAGTEVGLLSESLTVESLPASAVAKTALKDLSDSAGLVTDVDLVAGEQLIAERLIDPDEAEGEGSVEVPEGLHQVSFQLEPQRVVGARIEPGDLVGVLVSFGEGAVEEFAEEPTTQLAIRRVLVTGVQGAPQPNPEAPEQDATALPAGSLMITVAVDDVEAEKIVFAAEFGTIWLSGEPEEISDKDSSVMRKVEVYQ